MKKLISILPLLTICIIYLGYCYLHFYYTYFNLDIYNYISSSDILLSFLPIVILILTFLVGFINVKIINYKVIKNDDKDIIVSNENNTSVKKKTSVFKYILSSPLTYILLLLIVYHILRKYLLQYYYDFELQYLELSFFITMYSLILWNVYSNSKLDLYLKQPILFMLFLIVTSTIIISSFRKLDAKKIKFGIPVKQVSFIYKNKLYKSNQNILFVGQTQTSIFLYQRSNNSTMVFNTSEVEFLVFN